MFLQNKYFFVYFSLVATAKSRKTPDGYTERHHIIPKCLGGNDQPENLVVFTAREHFLAHRLLTKITTGESKAKMIFAANSMLRSTCWQDRRIVGSRTVAFLREEAARATGDLHRGKTLSPKTRAKIAEARRGKPSPNKGKKMDYTSEVRAKISNTHKGKTLSPEHIEAIKDKNTGSRRSEETKARMRSAAASRPSQGPMSDEQKAKISEALKGRPKPSLRGRAPWNEGLEHSAETRAKIKAAAANREKISCTHCGKSASPSNHARWHGDNCRQR